MHDGLTYQPFQWPVPTDLTIKHLPLDPHRVALEEAPHLLSQHPECLSQGVEGRHGAGVVVSTGDGETQHSEPRSGGPSTAREPHCIMERPFYGSLAKRLDGA